MIDFDQLEIQTITSKSAVLAHFPRIKTKPRKIQCASYKRHNEKRQMTFELVCMAAFNRYRLLGANI